MLKGKSYGLPPATYMCFINGHLLLTRINFGSNMDK